MGMNKKPLFMITTTDNPYNPFTDWLPWYHEDLRLGYDTCGLIARHAVASDNIDDGADLDAMRTVIEHNYSGKHIMVTPDTFDALIKIKD